MTIKYLDSKRVSGVASDTKPTDVQDNSIYIETDTDRRYWFETATAPTLEDDFSSDGWTDVGGFTGVSGGVLTGDLIRNNTNHGAGRAITALDNAAWVMRFKLVINTKATSENNSVVMGISQTGVTGINDPRYGLGVGLSQYHNKFRLVYPANQTWYQAVVNTAGSDPVPDTGTYYIELKRTSTTSVTLNIFSDSDYSTNIATVTQTISSGINALDNLDVQGMNDGGSGGTWNISIDDLKIWDGVTSAPVNTWVKMADPFYGLYQSDFADNNNTGWTMTSSISVTGNEMYANGINANQQYYAYYDLGVLSDTKWYVEVDFNFTNTGGGEALIVGLSSGTPLIWQNGGADALAINISGTGSIGGRVRYTTTDDHFTSGGTISNNGTWGYVVFERYDSNTMKTHIYPTDTDRKNKTNGTTYTGTITGSNITNLRYLQVGGWYVGHSASRVVYGHWDNIKVYNGVNW